MPFTVVALTSALFESNVLEIALSRLAAAIITFVALIAKQTPPAQIWVAPREQHLYHAY